MIQILLISPDQFIQSYNKNRYIYNVRSRQSLRRSFAITGIS